MASTDSRTLRAYMAIVVAVAAPLVGYAIGQAIGAAPENFTGRRALIIGVFSVIVVVGELWPIPVARGKEAGDEVTVSSTFGFGLLLMAPVIMVILAQALALLVDALVRHRARGRVLFNIAQYSIAFVCARAVYAAVAERPFTPGETVHLPSLVGALFAGLTFLAINNSLVGIAVSIAVQMRLARVLVDDLRWQITTSAPLLGLGPLAVQAMFWTPASIVLLLMPILALHYSGTLAMRREQQALRDTLTGVANRAMLQRESADALSKSTGMTAMLLLDLDHFKDINDTLGHSVGDQMLCAVADRLCAQAGKNDLVARLGGDEFVVLVRNGRDRDTVVALAEDICRAVREPVALENITLTVGCSVGIAFADDGVESVSDLLRQADIALYTAKDTRGSAAVYRKEDDRHTSTQLALHADLRLALEDPDDEQLWVAFQPQLDLASRTVESVECLIRWDHPTLGQIDPGVFVPIAESNSLIDLVLDRVLDRALRQLARWDRTGIHLRASVNLSARQLTDLALPLTVCGHLERHRIAAERLVLEVTESRLMADPQRGAQIVAELHAIGVRTAIDDFGTGYSSLAYLQRLAVDEIKIDRSFVARLLDDGAPIIRSIIDLGHGMGLRVVAEGVEDLAVARMLAELGCDVLQGFLIGEPVPAHDIRRATERHAAASTLDPAIAAGPAA